MKITLDREGPVPDPRWQEELDLITTPGGRLSWLHLYWEPGDTWEPIHRWFIGQVIPRASIPNLYSKRQWEFYHDTGCLLIPHWVIQGTEGGHKYRFNRVEQNILKLKGRDPTPWEPGDLPYAEPDSRMFRKLLEADLMRKFEYTTNYMENTTTRLREDERTLLVEMRERLWDWLGEQVREPSDKIAHLQRKNVFPDLPPADPRLDEKYEAEENQFLQGV